MQCIRDVKKCTCMLFICVFHLLWTKQPDFSGKKLSLRCSFFFVSRYLHPLAVPSNVTDVTALWVTSDSAALQWVGPDNVPDHVQQSYSVLLRDTEKLQTTDNNTVVINGLRPFYEYGVSIRAHAVHLNIPYHSEETFFTFKTDAGTPGPVVELVVTPSEEPSKIRVSWKLPVEPNGPIAQYILRVYDANGENVAQTYETLDRR